MPEQSKIKCCPFCGYNDLEVCLHVNKTFVMCHFCGCRGPYYTSDEYAREYVLDEERELVIQNWNHRSKCEE